MFDFVDLKSVIVPKFFKDNINHLKLGNHFIRVYRVNAFPSEFTFGLLENAFKGLPVKYYFKSKPFRMNMGKAITKEINKLENKKRKEKDKLVAENYQKQIDELEELIVDLTISKNHVLDTTLVFGVYAKALQELKNNCEIVENKLINTYKFNVLACEYRQEEIFKEVLPLWSKSGLLAEQKYDYALPLTTRSFAALWPFFYEEVRDYKGSLIGYENRNGGIIKFNPFLWLDDKSAALASDITAGNIFICGKTGFGKSTLEIKLFKILIKDNIKTIWIDPENKNYDLVKKYGGNYVFFGTPNNIINVLGLKRIGSDEDETVNPYDTEIAINNCIRDFKELLKLYHANDVKDVHRATNVIDDIIRCAYREKGIIAKDFRNYKESDYPIISDVVRILNRFIEERRLSANDNDYILDLYIKLDAYLKPFINSESCYFNGHTNIKFDDENILLGIGTKMLNNAADELKNSVFYLLMQYVSGFAYNTSGSRSAIIWDELHKYALLGYSLAILEDLQRRVRKYNCINIMATQEPADLNSDVLVRGASAKTHGQAIFNNTTYFFIMHLDEKPSKVLSDLMNIKESEKETINSLSQGDALFIKGKEHYNIHIHLNENEIKESS